MKANWDTLFAATFLTVAGLSAIGAAIWACMPPITFWAILYVPLAAVLGAVVGGSFYFFFGLMSVVCVAGPMAFGEMILPPVISDGRLGALWRGLAGIVVLTAISVDVTIAQIPADQISPLAVWPIGEYSSLAFAGLLVYRVLYEIRHRRQPHLVP